MNSIVYSMLRFEELTKYNLSKFVQDTSLFFKNGFPKIISFFSGTTNTVESSVLNEHKRLLKEADVAVQQFKTNAEKLETVEYWELLDFVEDLRTKLQTISKTSKYLRSSRVDFNDGNGFSYTYTLGDGQTLENISRNVLQDNDSENDWTKIALNNDLLESGWDMDDGKKVTIYKEKFMTSPVTTFIDNMIGEKIYGIDIDRKITFEDDDVKTLSYRDTVYQSADILSGLKKGDIPQYPVLGIDSSLYVGSNIGMMSYSSVVRELTKNFSTDDLFINFSVTDIELVNDAFKLKYTVDTKYKMIVENTAIV